MENHLAKQKTKKRTQLRITKNAVKPEGGILYTEAEGHPYHRKTGFR